MRFLVFLTVTLLTIGSAARAKEPSKADITKDANIIFNSIMEAMPKDLRASVDSASIVQKTLPSCSTNALLPSEKNTPKINGRGSQNRGVEKLPEEVQLQVLKTIQEIEQQSTIRMLEFKENMHQNKINP